jgi:hypothetical protein
MNRSFVIHKFAAVLVFFVWVAAIIAMIINREFWGGALPYVLLVSIATMAGTVLHSRYRIRHNSRPSYGSIISVPFMCNFVFFLGILLWGAWRNNEWDVFTLEYWRHTKGGIDDLIASFLILWFVCLFPATAIVIYFQKPNDSK